MEHTSHDSLSVARRIEEAGMGQTQAEAIAMAIRGSIKEATAGLATKADLALMQGEIAKVDAKIAKVDAKITAVDANVDTVKSEFKNEISHLRTDMSWLPFRVCWWMLLTLSTTAGLLLAARQLWISGLPQSLFG